MAELLEQLDQQQAIADQLEGLVNIQIYVTSAKKMTDLSSFVLNAALQLYYEKYKKDLITAIKSRAIPGRPNWQKVHDLYDQVLLQIPTLMICRYAEKLWRCGVAESLYFTVVHQQSLKNYGKSAPSLTLGFSKSPTEESSLSFLMYHSKFKIFVMHRKEQTRVFYGL